MSDDDLTYHLGRHEHCRRMAEQAHHPEVRRRHEELAQLHASRIEQAPIRQLS